VPTTPSTPPAKIAATMIGTAVVSTPPSIHARATDSGSSSG
jgi:hypothetical protein